MQQVESRFGIVNDYQGDPISILKDRAEAYALWDINWLIRLAGKGTKYKYLLVYHPDIVAYQHENKVKTISSALHEIAGADIQPVTIGLFIESHVDILTTIVQTLDEYVSDWRR